MNRLGKFLAAAFLASFLAGCGSDDKKSTGGEYTNPGAPSKTGGSGGGPATPPPPPPPPPLPGK